MFTIDQIKAAHSKVKSGADFPNYIQEIKKLGVLSYKTFIKDGHTDYQGKGNYQTSSPPRYDALTIADKCAIETFKADLKAHQQGKSDYPTFCNNCARFGVEGWIVSIEKMTCTYYDTAGNVVLVEQIPVNRD